MVDRGRMPAIVKDGFHNRIMNRNAPSWNETWMLDYTRVENLLQRKASWRRTQSPIISSLQTPGSGGTETCKTKDSY